MKAYVCGKRSGVIAEKPFYMGETLEGECKLDINTEMKLVQETLNELEADEYSPKEVITSTMKDLGSKRTIDGTIVGFGKGKLKCLPAKHDAVIDLVR
ncbi:hypothetical protein Q3G72_021829 [Acer saccharum]|nr:hypothetical protein Q3G72_021829 [Acer saccharum]